LKTPILLIKELEDKLAQNKRGRIIFIGSVYGKTGSAVESVYSALKAGQEIFAKSYAKEVATRKITVNTIAPGAIDTQMNSHFTFDEKRQLIEEIPAARLGKPSDVAHVTAFLAHKNSDYITGSTITVDGGWS
ncbi:MAG: SDR family oxidoreductase, partial [Streptococcaceae bacterium]|nr:SDR family oxidoreductase [Streptococcaceae bacterium]